MVEPMALCPRHCFTRARPALTAANLRCKLPRMADEEPDRHENLRVEYQKAQDSAEHHDNLAWAVVGLILSGIAVLFGLTLGGSDAKLPLWIVSASGLGLCALLSFFVEQFAHVRNQKYSRCKTIERELGMEQHSSLDYPKRLFGLTIKQRHVVHFISGLFALGWIILLACRCLGR